MSIIKSVALDVKSAAIAETLPNFSHFVRECLYRHAINMNTEVCDREIPWRELDRCNPFQQPLCFVCWPKGCPPKEAVAKVTRPGSQIHHSDIPYLDSEAEKNNQFLIDLKGFSVQPNVQQMEKPKIGLLGRFKRLWSSDV